MTHPCDSLTGRDRLLCRQKRAFLELWHGYQEPAPRTPTLLQKAASFAKAVVRHVADGATQASDEMVQQRMAVCHGCDRFDVQRVRCLECGCGLTLKSRWRTSTCPLGKWESVAGDRRLSPAPDASPDESSVVGIGDLGTSTAPGALDHRGIPERVAIGSGVDVGMEHGPGSKQAASEQYQEQQIIAAPQADFSHSSPPAQDNANGVK